MECLFCKIAQGQVPAQILFEDHELMAFQDIAPQAPTHILIIPKIHLATLNDLKPEHEGLLGRLILRAQQLAAEQHCSQSGYRLVWNVNKDAGQAVYHIHLHLLGGRAMHWPPG